MRPAERCADSNDAIQKMHAMTRLPPFFLGLTLCASLFWATAPLDVALAESPDAPETLDVTETMDPDEPAGELPLGDLRTFAEVFGRIKEEYVEEITKTGLFRSISFNFLTHWPEIVAKDGIPPE